MFFPITPQPENGAPPHFLTGFDVDGATGQAVIVDGTGFAPGLDGLG
jgi:hypothetical protein